MGNGRPSEPARGHYPFAFETETVWEANESDSTRVNYQQAIYYIEEAAIEQQQGSERASVSESLCLSTAEYSSCALNVIDAPKHTSSGKFSRLSH